VNVLSFDAPELEQMLRHINDARRDGTGDAATLEARIAASFDASTRLAVYGSLAPGRSNHHIVAALGGSWSDGWVEGDMYESGWGEAHGYPGFVWRPGGERVAVKLLVAGSLRDSWPKLDEFEGDDYRRSLVPVFADDDERRLIAIANVYECRPGGAAAPTADS
jgi:gamma-glutamylcyclotransferase (GGCT)/AIG2-like uncharacterized protein YtfP